jgi:hypothetical protein
VLDEVFSDLRCFQICRSFPMAIAPFPSRLLTEPSITMNECDPSIDPAAQTDPQGPRYTTFSEAFDTARQDAASMAREAAPKLKQALAGAAHDLAYGAAFGACFAACFAREIIPESLRETLRRGADAGRDAAAKTTEAPEPRPFTDAAPV